MTNITDTNRLQSALEELLASLTAVEEPEPAQKEVPPPRESMGAVPKYLTLERKDARLRLEQLEELSRLTRQLNKARGGRGERITDNTLIRVAVDLLLQHQDQLSGCTEVELRESVTRD